MNTQEIDAKSLQNAYRLFRYRTILLWESL